MENYYIIIFLVILLLFLSIGSLIGTALGMIAIVFYLLFLDVDFLQAIGPVVYNAWTSYSLAAIPMFVFMASILSSSGVGERLYSGSAALFSRLPGGLLHANIMASAGFGAVCGSTAATTAAISEVAVPYMDKEKYPEKLALGSLLAGGGLGLMIPPSTAFIIYGMVTGVSVGKLFMAGIFPGIMIAFLFSGYIAIFCKVTNQPIPTYKVGFKETVLRLLSTWPVVGLFGVIMASIFFGVTTTTEASGLGVLASIIIAIVLRRFSKTMITESLSRAVKITIMMYFIIGAGFVLANSFSNLGVAQRLINSMTEGGVSAERLLVLVSLVYLVLGMVFDAAASMIATLPVIFPAVTAVGIDPIWFGVIVTVYMEMAAITPPVGVNLFILQSVTGKPMHRVVRGIVPFFFLYLLTIVILYFFPEIATFLPNLMY